jgi:hypothetical protein
MELRHLRVAENLSGTRAAARLGIAQPALPKSIAGPEEPVKRGDLNERQLPETDSCAVDGRDGR